ncbi:MAG: hypothetical protein M3032_09335, partial [Verrucomicrobiota bacterium]|nr:hypothetical protein [Verrucomicrobiota bacterium]
MKARLYGDRLAVVIGKTRVKGTAERNAFDRVVQFTDTLIKQEVPWQLAAGHVSPSRERAASHQRESAVQEKCRTVIRRPAFHDVSN